MAITRSTASKNAAVNAVVDLIDVGTTNATGRLIIMTSGDVEVATLNMSNPAFGASVAGVATASAITSDTSATGGTAALFKVVDRDETEVFRGTVGMVGADLNLSSLEIGAGDTVSVASFTYTSGA